MEHANSCTKHGYAVILFLAVLFYNCNFLEAKTLPPWLPWFTYTGDIDNLTQYLQDKAPIGQRNVFLLAKDVSITDNIDLTSSYYAQELPFELTIVCETLEVTNTRTIDLSGANAPDYVSAAAMNPPSGIIGPISSPHSSYSGNVAWDGKVGADGGSVYIYAKNKRGNGRLNINVSGGDGGRGQDGRKGNRGTPQSWFFPVQHGEDGGDGGKGGGGGDAGEIVVNSVSNPSNILGQRTSGGGSGGEGGTGGRGGGGATASWWFLTNAKPGEKGDDGARGMAGSRTSADRNTLRNSDDFYRSTPITGNYLQRALNAEMYKIMLARYQNGNDRWTKIRNSVEWIRDIATANKYDIVRERCTYMLGLCDQFQNQARLFSTTRISKSAINDHINKLKSVAKLAVTIVPSNLNDKIQNSQLLKDHSHYVRAFNHMARQFNKSKERYDNAKELAGLFSVSFNIASKIKKFISSRFSSKLSSKITSLARSKPFIRSALDSVGTGGEVAVDTAEILGELVASTEAAPLLGLVVAERVVQPDIERVAVDIIGGSIISELNRDWGNLFDDIENALANSERIIQARGQQKKQTGSNRNARVRKDEKVRGTSLPNSRKPFKRLGRQDQTRLRLRGSDPPKPKPYELTGKFIGVLDKLEPVETPNSNQVVASFDALYVMFTVPKGESTVSLNSLDANQQEELFSTLEIYQLPFSTLPSFFITTTVKSQLINENKIGKWFEFDCEFGSGASDAAIVSPIIAFTGTEYLVLSFMASLDTDDDIPATVIANSIKQLNAAMEAKIILVLDLDTFSVTAQQGQFKRQVTGNSQYCGNSEDNYVIRRVEVANVGQGSCNLLYTPGHDSDPAAVYDLGYGKGKLAATSENNLIDKIAQAHSIIISHWDLDHYRYLLRNPQRILETSKYVTAPEFGSNTGVSVRRAVRSIRDYRRRLIATNTGDIPFYGAVVHNIDMYTTTTDAGRNKNDVGAITVSILDYNCNPLILMPGDASYAYVSDQQKSGQNYPLQNSASLKYLVATHHGSTRNLVQIPQALNNHFLSSVVMYSYGLNNRYGHSSATAQPFYQQSGWNANPRNTVGTEHGLYVNLDLDRSNLTPPHTF